jgi:RHS repeat-associated protein
MTRKTAKVGGAITTYEYDAENKLVRVVSPNTTANYKYDGLGRRVEKEVTQTGTTKVTRYVYDNEDILLELDGFNNIAARYTHGPGIDEPLVMEKGGTSFFYHADGLGSITEITDTSGVVKQRYTYSSFGEIESQLDPNFVQLYTFTSRELDPETGLYYYRARYYDAKIGRFVQEDPVKGILEIPQTQHSYAYVLNDPIRLVDPSGEVIPLAVVIVGVGGLVGGGLEAAATFRAGGGVEDVTRAFGKGFVSGAVGTATGLLTGLVTGNPFLIGASAGLAADLSRQLISNGFQVGCLDAISAATSTGLGAVLGSAVKGIPGLKTRGPLPDLFRPRHLNEFGANSQRLVGQEAVGGAMGGTLMEALNQN